MEDKKESILRGYPNLISYECSKKIMNQMENNICKIIIDEEQGTGFFYKIPFPDVNNMIPVFITNNHIINEELLYKKDAIIEINIHNESNIKKLNLNKRKKYTNKDYDTTIIEIKKEDEINNYLELDDNILNDIIKNDNKNKNYRDETIYIIQYPKGKLSVSYGILDKINENNKSEFTHKCSTEGGSSGSPTLNINNKLIGIHKGGSNNKYNKGTFLNYPIKEYIKQFYKDDTRMVSLKQFSKLYISGEYDFIKFVKKAFKNSIIDILKSQSFAEILPTKKDNVHSEGHYQSKSGNAKKRRENLNHVISVVNLKIIKLFEDMTNYISEDNITKEMQDFFKFITSENNFVPYSFYSLLELSRIKTSVGFILKMNPDQKLMIAGIYIIIKILVYYFLIQHNFVKEEDKN